VAIVCSGTHGEAAYEDALAAGALCDLLWDTWAARSLADSVRMARQLYLAARSDLAAAIRNSRNARRLLAIPELGDDVEFAFRRDSLPVLARLDADGCIRRVG
jgi:phosphosulfolactate phosphohydrolase-like enzyme